MVTLSNSSTDCADVGQSGAERKSGCAITADLCFPLDSQQHRKLLEVPPWIVQGGPCLWVASPFNQDQTEMHPNSGQRAKTTSAPRSFVSAGLTFAVVPAFLFTASSWAQNEGPPYPGGADITFQWDYSCPTGKACSFSCPGAGGASSVTKLSIYLGTIPVGSTQNAEAVFYEFSTRDIPRGNGFSINTGISTLSCQVNGMKLDYSGPPK
jgi:hypothetical protein